jgi:DNA polymerase III subunit alpha
MKHSDFVHLHNHSDYSLLDGATPIPKMVKRAAELGMPALALTDHGAMFGAVQFYLEAHKAGVKPIVGMEAYVTRGSRRDRIPKDTAHHLVLLARDEAGFHNLMRLSSLAYLEGFYYKPRVDHEILAKYSAGLLALSACPQGEIAADLLEDRDDEALKTAMMYRDIFGAENYFLEVQNHGIDIEVKIREKVRQLARKTGLPIVATNDCHYLAKDHTSAQDVLICIGTGKTVTDQQRMHAFEQLHFRTPEEMKLAFEDFPDAISNTIAVAERCNLKMNFGKPLLPEFPLPDGWQSADEYFRDLAWKELHARMGDGVGDAAKARFAYELDVICKMGFASYFLIVRDFIFFAKSNGIGVGPGRGSVAGSLVAFALRITDVDPLKHDLIFERFLNPERVSMPDIDIDFDDLRRGEVIDYVKRKYGETNVTQIITFGTMGAKGVIRDVGRALGFPIAEIDRIAKLVPDKLGTTLDDAIKLTPELAALPAKNADYARLIQSARVLEGLARHPSTHAAGVLITPGPLLDYVPLYRQKDGTTTTQWDMKSVEKSGLLKMDFLGLRTLSVLDEGVRLVKSVHGVDIDWQTLDFDDPATYRIFQTGDTVAVFQFESTGMRDHLRKLRPTVFEDLVAMNALYRPGPMENIPYFIDCKHGRQVAKYDHPKLEPVLKGTYGVFVYQEQVMAAAHDLAGFSMSQADELRRAMGKKNVEEMDKKRVQFIEGCGTSFKINPKTAEKIFSTMQKFAGYGFNKCVAAGTVIADATTGERTTVGELFEHRRAFRVHALGNDWKLASRDVTDVVWNGVKPVFELRTELGHRILATANHPFRTLNGWTNLEDLSPGDRIAAPRTLPTMGRVRLPRHELVALAGLLGRGGRCEPMDLRAAFRSRELVEEFTAAVAGFECSRTEVVARAGGLREVRVCAEPDITGGAPGQPWAAVEGSLALDREAVAPRAGMFAWADQLGMARVAGAERAMPAAVFECDEECVAFLLGRLWSADGFVADAARCVPRYNAASAALARGVQALLLRLGIVARIRTDRAAAQGGCTVRLVGDDALGRFAQRVVPHVIGQAEGIARLRGHLRVGATAPAGLDSAPIEVAAWLERDCSESGVSRPALRRIVETEPGNPDAPATRGYSRQAIWRVARATRSRRLRELASSDVFWDRVVAIEFVGEEDTYDLTVADDHNFIADGLVVHNSHSAAYALVAYQCAWLKAHYPPEFMAATMTSEMSDSSRIQTLIEECRRLKIELLPPDVNLSEWKFTIEDGKIRVGLGAVRNVGQGAVEALLRARAAEGPFRDLYSLAARAEAGALNKRVLESLVQAGACDALGGTRSSLFAGAAMALDHAAAEHREQASGQSSLFGGGDEPHAVAVTAAPLPQLPEWTSAEMSAKEKEVLGFYLSEHPLEHLRAEIERIATSGIAQALEQGHEAEVRIVGIVGEVKQITTKAGKLMARITLEDMTGKVECTLFPEAFEQARSLLVTDAIVVASGRVEVREERGAQLLLNEIRPWDQGREQFRPVLQIELRAETMTEACLADVAEVLAAHPGESEVYLYVVRPDHSRLAMRSRRWRVAAQDAVVTQLKARVPSCRVRWGKGLT